MSGGTDRPLGVGNLQGVRIEGDTIVVQNPLSRMTRIEALTHAGYLIGAAAGASNDQKDFLAQLRKAT
jgi:hypothetical protein